VLLCVIAGMVAYNVGLTQGLARAGGEPGAAAYAYGWHHPWGFGLPFFPGFLLIFLWFAVLRGLWWGGRYRFGGGWHRRGGFPPEAFEEWHRQAHAREKGQQGADDSDRRGRPADLDDRV
jgi:hypothetical protein